MGNSSNAVWLLDFKDNLLTVLHKTSPDYQLLALLQQVQLAFHGLTKEQVRTLAEELSAWAKIEDYTEPLKSLLAMNGDQLSVEELLEAITDTWRRSLAASFPALGD